MWIAREIYGITDILNITGVEGLHDYIGFVRVPLKSNCVHCALCDWNDGTEFGNHNTAAVP